MYTVFLSIFAMQQNPNITFFSNYRKSKLKLENFEMLLTRKRNLPNKLRMKPAKLELEARFCAFVHSTLDIKRSGNKQQSNSIAYVFGYGLLEICDFTLLNNARGRMLSQTAIVRTMNILLTTEIRSLCPDLFLYYKLVFSFSIPTRYILSRSRHLEAIYR